MDVKNEKTSIVQTEKYNIELLKAVIMQSHVITEEGAEKLTRFLEELVQERDDYALLIFQPCGEAHHDATKCPYCIENLNAKS